VTTGIGVGQSRGVILLAAAEACIPVVSYTPLAVKRTITGDGKADKKQVTSMVVRILKLKKAPLVDDTTDALAIAMTHAYSYRMKEHL
jgi:crossover junction endodeoxyribonuclease RuvC